MTSFEWFLLVIVVIVVPLIVAIVVTLWTIDQANKRKRANRTDPQVGVKRKAALSDEDVAARRAARAERATPLPDAPPSYSTTVAGASLNEGPAEATINETVIPPTEAVNDVPASSEPATPVPDAPSVPSPGNDGASDSSSSSDGGSSDGGSTSN